MKYALPPLKLCVMIMLSLPWSGGTASAQFLEDQAVTYADFNYVIDITASMSRVYFATDNGVIRYNKTRNEWEEPLTGTPGLDHRDIQRIWVDHFDQELFAQTSLGLYEFDFLFQSWTARSSVPNLNNQGRHIKPPQVMYAPPGFNYDGGDGRLIDRWGRYFLLNDVLDDGSGRLWIGTWGYGALEAGAASHRLELLPFGLLQNRVNAIYMDGGTLLVSGAVFNDVRTGLSIFDLEANSFAYIESGVERDFPAVDINCIFADSSSLYVGTPVGLLVLERKSRLVNQRIDDRNGLPHDNVLSLEVVGDRMFVGTAGGLGIVQTDNDSVYSIHPTQFANEIIYDLEQVDSTVWISSSAGAYRFKLESGKLQRFQDPEQVLFGDVYDIERHDSLIWFLSRDGLVQLNMNSGGSQSFHHVTERLFPNALAVNDTIAVVGSDKGITILFHANSAPFTRDFTTDDGLSSNYVYSLEFDGDYLWIGSDRGLTRFLWNNPRRVD